MLVKTNIKHRFNKLIILSNGISLLVDSEGVAKVNKEHEVALKEMLEKYDYGFEILKENQGTNIKSDLALDNIGELSQKELIAFMKENNIELPLSTKKENLIEEIKKYLS
jgi:hypothetical protein